MWQFITLYSLLAISGLSLLKLDRIQPAIEQFCLGLAIISGQLINLFDSSIQRTVTILRDQETLFAIEVTNSCSALSISWLYVAGVLAYPLLSIKQKIISLLIGLLLIQSMNIIRLISLVYLGSWIDLELFDLIHLYFWPLMINLLTLICLVFVLFQAPATNTQTTSH